MFGEITYWEKKRGNERRRNFYKPFRERSSNSRENREEDSLDFFVNKRERDGERLLESKISQSIFSERYLSFYLPITSVSE